MAVDGRFVPTGSGSARSTATRPCYSFPVASGDRETPLSIENIVKEVRAEIGRLQQVLALLGGHGVSVKRKTKAVTAGPRRTMSAAARKKIAAAQRARWAKVRAGKK